MEDTLEIYFHISPFLNLYYSLEVATGTIIEEYNEEYAGRMSKILPDHIMKKYKQLHDAQRFSFKIKSSLFDDVSEAKIKDSMLLLAKQFNDLLNEAFSHYQTYWKEVSPSLMKAREVLEVNKNECKRLLMMVSDLLHIPWRIEELHIHLVGPFTGEPINENTICLGVGFITTTLPVHLTTITYFFILHEATHTLVSDSVRTMAERYTTEEHAEFIDEAIMNLISNSILKLDAEFQGNFNKAMEVADKLKFPPPSYIERSKTPEGEIHKARHEKRNHYITYYRELFQSQWEEALARNEVFHVIVSSLLQRNAEEIKRA